MRGIPIRCFTATLVVAAAGLVTTPTWSAPKPPAAPTKVAASKFKTLPGGLKYAVLKPGKGKGANHQEVYVHYTGWLKSNGKRFDSSIGKPPYKFELGHGQVIKGWDLGVKGMKVGEKRQLIVPPALAYAQQGFGSVIPPGATLIFDVELVRLGGHSH